MGTSAAFQSTVPTQYGAGVPGSLYDDSPVRSAPWLLNSSSAAYNIIGATAFTASSADPGTGITTGVAAAGGTGTFVGVLANLKTAVTAGTTTGALTASASLPNNVTGEMVTMGHLWVTLPGTANVGDKIAYDSTTGALMSYPKTTAFTASLLTTGVLSVTAVTAGFLQPGMVIATGAGAVGLTIVSYGTGLGNTGTYNTDGVGVAAVSAEAMTALTLPPPAFSGTAVVLTTGVMSITATSSGEVGVGSVISGTGIPAYCTIIALGTGVGGTGTYTVSPAPSANTTSGTVTADLAVDIPRAEVILFQPAGQGGLGVISLTGP